MSEYDRNLQKPFYRDAARYNSPTGWIVGAIVIVILIVIAYAYSSGTFGNNTAEHHAATTPAPAVVPVIPATPAPAPSKTPKP